jgi:hypothetical protein
MSNAKSSDYVKLVTDAGDQYLAKMAEAQETFLKNTAAFTAQFAGMAPPVEMPAAFTATFATFPTPLEVTEASFAFATKLLKQQKTFAEKLAGAAPAAK